MTTKQFSRLSDKTKRITLAKDVILQLKAKKILTNSGSYVLNDEISFYSGKELQIVLQNTKIPCEVCAKGSLFICEVMQRNDFKLTTAIGNLEVTKRLTFFSKDQLDLIETAFELWPVEESNNSLVNDRYRFNTFCKEDYDFKEWYKENKQYMTELAFKAIRFGRRYKNETNRLIAILTNLIENQGEFKP